MKKIILFLAVSLCLVLALRIAFSPAGRSARLAGAQPASTSPVSAEARSSFAHKLESQLAQKGIPARVTVEGQDQNQLRIEWQGITRHDIYDLATSTVIHDARPLGVKSVVFADGGGSRNCGSLSKADCEERWDYDLDRESMIWHPSQL
jgi:hypothetical protein